MNIWLSYHVYTELNRTEVLSNRVTSIIEWVENNESIHQFFYIRYNEGGKHLRLRFESSNSAIKEIDSMVRRCFFSNQFQVMEESYNPEISRYGGSDALPTAEEYFQLSSKVCLAVLNEKPHDILSRALILHFAMAKACSKKPVELIQFFKRYLHNWFSYSGLLEQHSDINRIAKDYFEPRYIEMNTAAFFQNLSETFESNESTEISWLDSWYQGNRELLGKLDLLLNEEAFFSVLESLMHMTNNRLGIQNYDESFLAYLLKRILENQQTSSDVCLEQD